MTQARNLSRLLNKKLQTYKFTATSGQTSFADSDDGGNVLSYTPDNMLVTYNGVVLENGSEYTATNGTSVVLDTGADSAAEVNVYAFESVSLGGYLASDKGIDDNASSTALTIDASGQVGIGITSPTALLNVDGGNVHFSNNLGLGTTDLATDLGYSRKLKISGTGPAIHFEETDTSQDWAIAALGGILRIRDATNLSNVIQLDTNGDVTLAGGIYIGGTGSANLLDDYEEGTWTPTIASGGTIAGGGGYYRKIGSLVVVWCSYSVSTISGSGTFTIGGLPFTASNNFGSQGAVRNQGINNASYGNVLVVETLGGTTTVRFHYPSNTSGQYLAQVGDVSVGDFNAWTLMYDT